MNFSQIRVYDSVNGLPVQDPSHLLERVENIRFSTVYPNGIFETATFFIPCDPTRYSLIKHNQMVQIRNSLTTVWEGFITSIAIIIGTDRAGFDVQATGYWGLAFKRYKYNRWIDRRYSSNIFGVWEPYVTGDGLIGGQKTRFDQNDQILISPSSAWSYGETIYIRYRTNNANSVKRISFDYALGTVAEINPDRIKYYDSSAGTYTANITDMSDGNPTTYHPLVMDTGDYLYIATDDPDKVSGFRFDIGPFLNPTAATMKIEYYGVDSAWHTITITDGTATAGVTLSKSGTVSFTAFDGWNKISVNGATPYYYVRISFNVTLYMVQFNDIYVLRSQTWTLFLQDTEHVTTLWSTNTAGSGSQDITLSTASNYLSFALQSNEGQIVIGAGVYGKITNLAVISENWDGTSGTTVNYLLKAMTHYLGAPFLDDYTYIAANAYDLIDTGFVADGFDLPLAAQMEFIGRASATDDAYSVGVLESEAISGANYLPVIYYERVPALTDYDYAIRLDDENLSGVELVLSADLDQLYNSTIVTFKNTSGKTDWASASDYAALDDTTSQGKYFKRTLIVQGGQASTEALAGPIGAPYLKAKKDQSYYMRGPLQITGLIRKKDGSRVPVSTVRAGKRIKIENFSADMGDTLGSGLTFLISRTEYDDATDVMSITAGVSDDLALYLARMTVMNSGNP